MRKDLIAWSIIAPTPQCYYHAQSDSYIVYWQGWAMTRVQALMVIQSEWVSAYPSPKMKQSEFQNFKKAYMLGAFGNVTWNFDHHNAETHFQLLKKALQKHNPALLENLKKNYSLKEAMSWVFDVNTLESDER